MLESNIPKHILESSIEQGGLEMPCDLTILVPNGTKDNKTEIYKLRKLLA